MDPQPEIIEMSLPDGKIIKVEVTQTGERKVSSGSLFFEEATAVIKDITSEIAKTLQSIKTDIKPDKISIKLGLEVAIEGGHLTALIVKGASKANFEITMEWST